jgi:glutathione synthase/RimK-type ligase-like ATP-grasp enzyme
MSETPILIASCSFDRQTTEPVARELRARGHEVIAYESDMVASGEVAMSLQLNAGRLAVELNGDHFDPNAVGAAWYRRPNEFFTDEQEKANPLRCNAMTAEYRSSQRFLWNEVPNASWLNSPDAIRAAGNKMAQLRLAHSVGFNVPQTVISNRWNNVLDIEADELTYKTVHGTMYVEGDPVGIYSHTLPNDPGRLPMQTLPYPGIWQPNISKTREWRLTVVGETIFDVAIYTDDAAKNDWRQLQHNKNHVRFVVETIPEEVHQRCIEFLGAMGLRFGTFDFIENDDGITFLENNANGQYGWLEGMLGLPISAAIASELHTIAKNK